MAWILAGMLSCAAWAGVPSEEARDAAAADIERAVRELGHDDYAVRRRATHELWRAGEAAEPALRAALESPDPEVASRARWILERVRFGLLPDTPPQLVQLIEQFRYGNDAARREVLRRLTESGRIELAVQLIRSDPEPATRERLLNWMVSDIGQGVRQLILDGKLPVARQFLELAAQNEAGCRDLAAYLLLQNELSQEIAQRKQRLRQEPDAAEARLLGYLLRAGGDLRGALEVFDGPADDASAARGVLAELGDWKELAHRLDELPGATVADPFHAGDLAVDDLERQAVAAVFHGLAGNEAPHRSACAKLREAASANPDDAWPAAEALLIAGRVEEAIGLFIEHEHASTAFDLLAAQLRFDEAFRVAGMDGPGDAFDLSPDGNTPVEAIGDDKPVPDGTDGLPPKAEVSAARLALGLSVAQTLQRLGHAAEATALFDRLADVASDSPRLSLVRVCRAEHEVGLDDRAFRRAAAAIEPESAAALLGALFQQQAREAIRWWNYLAEQEPDAAPADRLARVRGIVEQTAPRDTLLAFARDAEGHAATIEPEPRAEWLIAVGELYLAADDADGARHCFERAADTHLSPETLVRLADFHFRRRRWPAAAEAYETALRLAVEQQSESLAHLAYLQGYARVQMGDEAEGQRLLAAARLLPLGSARARHTLAEALKQRELTKEAARQWQIILRTGQFNEWALNDAAKQLGNAVSGSDGLRAAGYWQRLLLSCLKRNASLTKADGYLKLVQLIHRLRARGLLEAGDTEAAVREARRAHAAMPGDVALVCDLVPRLDEAGLATEADRLFEGAYAHLLEAVESYAGAAPLLNNAAWMAATCGRRLDDALTLAERATGLSPANPVYLDTLAELHFLRGNHAKAVDLARRCVELDPDRDHYRRQLARFEEPE